MVTKGGTMNKIKRIICFILAIMIITPISLYAQDDTNVVGIINRPVYEVLLNTLYGDLTIVREETKTITDGRTQIIRVMENNEIRVSVTTLKDGDTEDIFFINILRKGAII